MWRPADTSEEADRLQFELWRNMSAEEKLRLVFEWSDAARAIFEAGIRDRHPEYTDDQVRIARIRRELGDELFRRVYPDQPLLQP
ncbi:MAG: hypothetical protein ACODAJ_16405 [Planctomycetota bacterium]